MITQIKAHVVAITLVAGMSVPVPVLAWGVPGCVNLPEYERALSTLCGMTTACGMSVEEANRIVAAQGNRPGGLLGRLLGAPPKPANEAAPVSPSFGSRTGQSRSR